MAAQSSLFSWLAQSYQCHAAVICLTGQPSYSSLWEIRAFPPLLAEQHSGNKKSVVKGCWHLKFKDPPSEKNSTGFLIASISLSIALQPIRDQGKALNFSLPLPSTTSAAWAEWEMTLALLFFSCCFPKIILMKGHGWMSRKNYCPDLQWNFPSFWQPRSGPGEFWSLPSPGQLWDFLVFKGVPVLPLRSLVIFFSSGILSANIRNRIIRTHEDIIEGLKVRMFRRLLPKYWEASYINFLKTEQYKISNTENNPAEDKGPITVYCIVKKKYFNSFYHPELSFEDSGSNGRLPSCSREFQISSQLNSKSWFSWE